MLCSFTIWSLHRTTRTSFSWLWLIPIICHTSAGMAHFKSWWFIGYNEKNEGLVQFTWTHQNDDNWRNSSQTKRCYGCRATFCLLTFICYVCSYLYFLQASFNGMLMECEIPTSQTNEVWLTIGDETSDVTVKMAIRPDSNPSDIFIYIYIYIYIQPPSSLLAAKSMEHSCSQWRRAISCCNNKRSTTITMCKGRTTCTSCSSALRWYSRCSGS